jgi:hypothetical protein
MVTYQLDESTDSKTFVESCKKQGLVEIWRCPRDLKGAKDPEVLKRVFPSGRTLLTTDRRIHFEHSAQIPDRHPGILILAKASSLTTMRIADVARILARFKSEFPNWHIASLRNSIVEICESHVEVWRVVHGSVSRDEFLSLDRSGWQEELSDLLERNARAGLLWQDP